MALLSISNRFPATAQALVYYRGRSRLQTFRTDPTASRRFAGSIRFSGVSNHPIPMRRASIGVVDKPLNMLAVCVYFTVSTSEFGKLRVCLEN
jgi:hypothetical protein